MQEAPSTNGVVDDPANPTVEKHRDEDSDDDEDDDGRNTAIEVTGSSHTRRVLFVVDD